MATSNTPITNISGLASGLDTNSIVSQLVALRKRPAVALNTQLSASQARQSGLQDASNTLSALRSAALALKDPSLWSSQQEATVSNSNILAVNKTGSAAPGGHDFNVLTLARAEQRRSASSFTAAGAADVLHIAVGTGSTVDVNISSGDSVSTMAEKINSASGIGVYASVVSGRLYLAGKSSGAANTISITSDGSLAADMGMSITSSAQDATYTMDGGAVQSSSSNTIKDSVAGLTIQFKQTGSAAVTVSDSQVSANSIADKLQAFVDAYNKSTKQLRTSISTKPTSGQSNTGLLFNNTSLQSAYSVLYDFANHSSSATSSSTLLGALGISNPKGGTNGGLGSATQLSFDRQAFLDAYAADPSAVAKAMNNFTGDATSEGLAQWVDRQMGSLIDTNGVLSLAIKGQTDQQASITARQKRINDSAANYEANLRKQYTAMETALSRLQSQQSQITGQINAMTASKNN